MSFFIENWVLFTVAIGSASMLLLPALTGKSGAHALSPNQAVQLMNRQKAVVVDVCSAPEFAAGHIAGAKNVPLPDLSTGLKKVMGKKPAPIIFVCASGSRSAKARAHAAQQGYEDSYSLAGGMTAWRAAGLPVEQSASS